MPEQRRPLPKSWLVFEDGSRVSVTAPELVLGRNPQPLTSNPAAQLVSVPSPERSVSRQHALLFRHGGHWMLRDLRSTNGTSVLDELGSEIPLAQGGEARVWSALLLGEVRVGIRSEGVVHE